MRILYDPQIFGLQAHGGISRYFYELMRRFLEDREIDFLLPIRRTGNGYLLRDRSIWPRTYLRGAAPFPRESSLLSRPSTPFALRAYRRVVRELRSRFPLWDENTRLAIRSLKHGAYDLFHPTYFNPYFLSRVCDRPYVLTVYDLTSERVSRFYPDLDSEVAKWRRQTVVNASAVIAISENTKRDLVEIYGVPERKIHVVYMGSSLVPAEVQDDSFVPRGLPDRFLLFVGERLYYKNFGFFLHAVARFVRETPDLFVVCAGGRPFTAEEKSFVRSLYLEDRVIHYGSISDQQLAVLYSKALCFVFPSLYEGFGIPILEAFSCGCPAVLSNRGSLPEIGGDAAVYFDPQDEHAIVSMIRSVIEDDSHRQQLIEAGRKRLRAFSWDTTAEQTKQIYRELV